MKNEKDSLFTDVSKESYYSKPIAWAAENGIVNGIGENRFAPNDSITRQDFVVILYRYATKMGFDTNLKNGNILGYEDANSISEYAVPAIKWAVERGIITGRTEDTLEPFGTATRAEVATMVMRFIKD